MFVTIFREVRSIDLLLHHVEVIYVIAQFTSVTIISVVAIIHCAFHQKGWF